MCRPAPASSLNSEPEFEHEECRQKARALMRAAEEAVRFAAGKSGGNTPG